jgi:hypothetical protein
VSIVEEQMQRQDRPLTDSHTETVRPWIVVRALPFRQQAWENSWWTFTPPGTASTSRAPLAAGERTPRSGCPVLRQPEIALRDFPGSGIPVAAAAPARSRESEETEIVRVSRIGSSLSGCLVDFLRPNIQRILRIAKSVASGSDFG